jgi:hypothetical protein
VVIVLDRRAKVVFVMLGIAAILRAAIGQHAAGLDLMGVVERHDPIIG